MSMDARDTDIFSALIYYLRNILQGHENMSFRLLCIEERVMKGLAISLGLHC